MSILNFKASASVSAINDFINWIESNKGQKAFARFNRQNRCNCYKWFGWDEEGNITYTIIEQAKYSQDPIEYAGNIILTFEHSFGNSNTNIKNGITKLVKALFNEYNKFTTTQRSMSNGRLIFQKIKEWSFFPYKVSYNDEGREQILIGVQVVIEVDDE